MPTHGVNEAIEEEYNLEKKKHDNAFCKLLAIANLWLGDECHLEIMKHWKTTNPPQLMLEKLHKLMLAQVDDEQKVKWLKIWNFGDLCKRREAFLLEVINDKELDVFFHTFTYWWQVMCISHFFFLFLTTIACILVFGFYT